MWLSADRVPVPAFWEVLVTPNAAATKYLLKKMWERKDLRGLHLVGIILSPRRKHDGEQAGMSWGGRMGPAVWKVWAVRKCRDICLCSVKFLLLCVGLGPTWTGAVDMWVFINLICVILSRHAQRFDCRSC